jgi:hypothetical protein
LIIYRLVCSTGHEFEAWFKDSAAFDAQCLESALQCPVCSDTGVKKAIMAPAVVKSGQPIVPRAEAPSPAQPGVPAAPPPDTQKIRQFMAGYRQFIQENAQYVGPKFPEEARKIHYGETEERHIYGESSLREARELIEEGIQIAPVPPDPDDLN